MKTRRWRVGAFGLGCLLLASCSSEGGSAPTSTPPLFLGEFRESTRSQAAALAKSPSIGMPKSDATGYRVYRADTPDGDFVLVADINIVNGNTSAASEVVNIWTAQHSYVPAGGALASRDTSSEFQYVELSDAGERCFKVRAYNAAGRGHSSSVSCSGPV